MWKAFSALCVLSMVLAAVTGRWFLLLVERQDVWMAVFVAGPLAILTGLLGSYAFWRAVREYDRKDLRLR